MERDLGPKAQRIYDSILHQISSGTLQTGSQLAPHTALAVEYGVAPLTVRQVLARLEDEGYVSREQGRGTFVRDRVVPTVMIVDDDPIVVKLLATHVRQAGFQPYIPKDPIEAVAALDTNHSIVLVLSDVRMPEKQTGIDFIRTVRRRYPNLPLAVLTGYPEDLNELHGSPEWPILILAKPIYSQHIKEALRFAMKRRAS